MTYKSRIETNNTELQSILETVNALPEAGDRPMCTVTTEYAWTVDMSYVNENNEYVTLPGSSGTSTVKIPNPSIIIMSNTPKAYTGNITSLISREANYEVFHVYGDCTIKTYGAPSAT